MKDERISSGLLLSDLECFLLHFKFFNKNTVFFKVYSKIWRL